jgi:Xaa-Pro aminopeptidase
MPPTVVEMDRRLSVLRTAMREQGYDALVVAGRTGAVESGFLRYLSAWRIWADAAYVVLPLAGDPVFILRARSQTYWARQESALENVVRADNLARCALDVLSAAGATSPGYVGLNTCGVPVDVATFRANAKAEHLSDATSLMVDAMIHKSEEEKGYQRATAQALAHAHRAFGAALRPGMSEREAVGIAVAEVYAAGCLDGIAHISNRQAPYIRPPSERPIERDDVLRFSMEFAGPEGYWVELSALYSFLPPSGDDQRLFDTTLSAFGRVEAMLRPGVASRDLARAAQETFEEAGYSDLGHAIWDAHGIGLNVIEPPLALPDDMGVLEDGMAINVHPGVVIGEAQRGMYIQDNFEVSAGGGLRQSGLDHRWNVVGAG